MSEDALLRRAQHFYEWEVRGRGWQTYSYPVELEPPFRPFEGHHRASAAREDDGKRESFFSKLLGSDTTEVLPSLKAPEEPLPEEYHGAAHLREVEVRAEPGERTDGTTDSWLSSLGGLVHHFAVELVGHAGEARYRLAFDRDDLLIEDSLQGLAPSLHVETAQPLAHLWHGRYSVIFECVLAREFMEPVVASLPDPQTPLLVALAQARKGECAVVQVLSAPVAFQWVESIRRSVLTPSGEPFFADNPRLTKRAFEKISSPLRAVVLRLAVSAESEGRVWQLL